MTSIWGKGGGQPTFDLPDDYVKDYLKVSRNHLQIIKSMVIENIFQFNAYCLAEI